MAILQKSGAVRAAVVFFTILTIAAISYPAGYSGGDGSAENPYQIASKDDLWTLHVTPDDYSMHFILTADIDMSGEFYATAVIAPDTDNLTDGFQGGVFWGSFDGNSHTISNLLIHDISNQYLGFFGKVGGSGRITNLCIDNAYIQSVNGLYVGGLVGYNHGGIGNCRVMNSFVSGSAWVGGLVGSNDHISGGIDASFVTGRVEGGYYIGGLVGSNGFRIGNSYALADVKGTDIRIGGLVGENLWEIFECFASGSVSGNGRVGGLVGENFAGVFQGDGKITSCYATGNVQGNSGVGGLVGLNYQATVIDCYSTGATNGGGLCGDKEDPYGSSQDTANYWDIDTSGTATSAMGVGKTTTDMKILSTFTSVGWDFISDWYMPDNDYPHLQWEKRYSGGSGSGADPYLIRTIEDLNMLSASPFDWDKHFLMIADLDLDGISYTQSLVAPDRGRAKGFQGKAFTGVFDGNGHRIYHLSIQSASQNYNGMFGFLGSGGQIRNLGVWDSEVSGLSYVGILVGWNQGTITSCFVESSVHSAEGTTLGGLCGHNSGTISASGAGCVVNGEDTVDNVGGLAGENEGIITACYATNSVNGRDNIGGLVGYNAASITTSCATDSVNGRDNNGGLVGRNSSGTISSCYATGAVNGREFEGGLLGWDSAGTITDCYSTGRITGSKHTGGLAGGAAASSAFTACFWDAQTSELSISAGGTVKETADMKKRSTFANAGWDFSYLDGNAADWVLWREGLDYPVLTWQPPLYGGGDGSEGSPWKIANLDHLMYLANHPADYSHHFILMADIDLAGTTFSQALIAPDIDGGTEYFQGTTFTGVFDGNGHRIRHLTISTAVNDYIGLFGDLGAGGQVQKLGIEDAYLSGRNYVGGLAGLNDGSIDLCYITGSVNGLGSGVGGLVGYDWSGTITSCYTVDSVQGNEQVGGLIGYNWSAAIWDCYAAGTLSGNSDVGGLLGVNNYGSVVTSFWDMEVSHLLSSAGGTGKSTADMKTLSTFTSVGWDFVSESANGTDDIWRMCVDGISYPRLSWEFPGGGDFACPDGVGLEDLLYLAGRWLAITPETAGAADLNGDGKVDLQDFGILAAEWMRE